MRALLLAWRRWQLDCLRFERQHYSDLGLVGIGYLRACHEQEQRLCARIRQLES